MIFTEVNERKDAEIARQRDLAELRKVDESVRIIKSALARKLITKEDFLRGMGEYGTNPL